MTRASTAENEEARPTPATSEARYDNSYANTEIERRKRALHDLTVEATVRRNKANEIMLADFYFENDSSEPLKDIEVTCLSFAKEPHLHRHR